MRKYPGLIILALLVGCSKAPVEITHYTIEQFFDNLSIGGGSFSADETKLLVSSNQTGIYNVFAIQVDGSGEQQLTFSDSSSIFAISYFPEDDRFLY
jgi:Tol biopolymer transport system component